MSTTWTALAGDTSSFAIEISFIQDTESHYYDDDERESWGSISLWVGGINVTEHFEQGELLRNAHWYLLPTIEWFAENWDPLFHEERLPLSNAGSDAAAAMTKLLIQPLRLVRADLDEFERLEEWQAWWARHNIVDSVNGGIFPDLYIRRWGDLVEISVGSTIAPGTPDHFRYQNQNVVGRLPAKFVAEAVYDVIGRAVAELARRRASSPRIAALRQNIDSLRDEDGGRYVRRLAYLSGVNAASEKQLADFVQTWSAVDELLDTDLDESAVIAAVGRQETGLLLETAPQVALMFGSQSPNVTRDDIQVLLRNLHTVLRTRRISGLPGLKTPAFSSLSPGEAGSLLGEAAYQVLGNSEASYVDVKGILARLEVTWSADQLSDQNTRAVSLLSAGYGTHIVINTNYHRGTSERVLRFTLAHELGHILLDRDRSLQMAIVSGPWAPRAIEQRANAFAAALLMPESLMELHARGLTGGLWWRQNALRMAAGLQVSVTSLADRMYNLLLVTREEADSVRRLAFADEQ